jgi:hypothetical protein
MTSESKKSAGTVVSTPGLTPRTKHQIAREAFEAQFGPYGWTVLISLFLLLCALVAVVRLAYVSNRMNDGFLVILVGALLGWAAGMFFSPYTVTERSNFVSISQAVSAFVSGYLLSKLDRFLEHSLFSKEGPDPATWTLIGFFSVAFMVFALGTYSCRRYFAAKEPKESEKNLDASAGAVKVSQAGTTQAPIAAEDPSSSG